MNRVVPDGRLAEETRDLLSRSTRGSPLSKGIGKRAFYRQVDMDIDAAYAYATEVMASASQTKDARETMRAFLEKRPPRFLVE